MIVKKNILLADDNKTFLMYIGLLLKRLGFQLLTAKNGLDALRLLKSNSADLVLLDVHMDTLDGITALRHIKSDDKTAHLPVIMISTDMSPETIKTCTDLGCLDYLQKPIKVDLLHDAIHRSFLVQGRPGRKHIRTICNKKVVVTFGNKQHNFYAETFAEGGIYVRTEYPFPTGSDVTVSVQLEDGRHRHYKGKVVYAINEFSDSSSTSPGMAIQFLGLSQDDNIELFNYMKTLLAGDIFEEQGEKKILER
jgi:CheY-like chemotaxis protein/Tfp pilus assembly protein PilZ